MQHPSAEKARKMMKEGMVRGHPLSKKQKGLFGLVAGGGEPSKLKKMASKARKSK